jgi:DNA invertase Pin-like site-specific DNA recombinase
MAAARSTLFWSIHFSRPFRNQFELTVRVLRKHKVELISFAEPLTNDASGELFRQFIGIVNEFQSPKPRVRPPAQ